MISHDLSVLADLCDRIAVMYAGRVVEERHRRAGLRRPAAPVRRRAVRGVPAGRRPGRAVRPGRAARRPARPARPARRAARSRRAARGPPTSACAAEPPLRDVRPRAGRPPASGSASRDDAASTSAATAPSCRRAGVRRRVHRPAAGTVARALDGVDLAVAAGEVVALVGRVGLRQDHAGPHPGRPGAPGRRRGPVSRARPLDRSARGLQGAPAPGAAGAPGPAGALNPRHTVYESVAEGLRLHRLVADDRGRPRPSWSPPPWPSAGLRPPERLFLRYPHELSGGQRQRVLIAGALALRPQLLIADEPVSSASTPRSAARSWRCCSSCARSSGSASLVVTHDLGLAWNIADRIAVMYLGRVVEAAPTEEVLDGAAAPLHPGPAVGRPGDRAARAGRAARRDPRPDPDPGGLPLPPALPGARRRARPTPGRRRLPRHAAADPPARPAGPPRAPATWSAARRASTGSTATTEVHAMTLQAALPRELYVDPAAWRARARAGAAARVDLRRPARRPRPRTSPSGSPSSTCWASRCW